MSLRKITKNRCSFPSDEALLKLFYLALRNISQKWTMPIRDWKAALARFTIQFEERMVTPEPNPVNTKFRTRPEGVAQGVSEDGLADAKQVWINPALSA